MNVVCFRANTVNEIVYLFHIFIINKVAKFQKIQTD